MAQQIKYYHTFGSITEKTTWEEAWQREADITEKVHQTYQSLTEILEIDSYNLTVKGRHMTISHTDKLCVNISGAHDGVAIDSLLPTYEIKLELSTGDMVLKIGYKRERKYLAGNNMDYTHGIQITLTCEDIQQLLETKQTIDRLLSDESPLKDQ